MKKSILLSAVILMLLPSILFGIEDSLSTSGWSSLGSGINGQVNALVYFNGNIIAGGDFDTAGGVSANNIALWNGSNWQPLLAGVNGVVTSLIVYNNELYAGGSFLSASGVPGTRRIAKWNGSSWSALVNGTNGYVYSLIIYDNALIVGGNFSSVGNSIAQWRGNSWSTLGNGVNKRVYSMTVFNNELIAAGTFDTAGNIPASKIAKWSNSSWSALSSSIFNGQINALTVYDDSLIAGGKFRIDTGVSANFLAKFNGTYWEKVGNGVHRFIDALTIFQNELIVGGSLLFAYNFPNDSVYVNRIARWNGNSWSKFSTGMNNYVLSLTSNDTSLIAGGTFTTAGGRFVNRIASWGNQQTYTIIGAVTYNTTSLPVNGGYVKAVRMDWNTREVLVLDSTQINPVDGSYILNNVRSDSVDVIAFPNDIIENDFVPTYYPSTIYWENAVTLNLINNASDINISVFRVESSDQISGSIGGKSILNFLPYDLMNGIGLKFKSDAIIYAKNGNSFRNFCISNSAEYYIVTSLPPGNYEIIATRLGYKSDSVSVLLTSCQNINKLNFVLDTLNNIITNIKINTNSIVSDYVLYQNYPNPFNPIASIKFGIPIASHIKVIVYDLLGREIISLINKDLNPGTYIINWDASYYPSGVYFYKLEAGEFISVKKMVLIK